MIDRDAANHEMIPADRVVNQKIWSLNPMTRSTQ